MSTFYERIQLIANEAFEQIRKQVPEKGAIHLKEPGEDFEDQTVGFTHFDKHGMSEYCTLSEIADVDGLITLKGYGEETGRECWQEIIFCSAHEICCIADIIASEATN